MGKKEKQAKLHPDLKFEAREIHRKQIKNAPYNPRQIAPLARKKLKGNISTVGLVEPLVWNEVTGNLVGGHQRLGILDERAGHGNYLLVVAAVHLTPEEEMTQNVFMNNPDTQGTYDADALGDMFVKHDVDYKETGFEDMTVQDMFVGSKYEIDSMFDVDSAPDAVKRDLDEISKIQRMKRERKEHKARDVEENDPEFYAVVVFPDRDAQSEFMEKATGDREGRYVDGARLRSSLEAAKPQKKTDKGDEFTALTFWVADEQKQVIEDEIVRLSALIKGKNVRARALEVMAAMSAQTALENVTGEEPEKKPAFKARKK